MNKDTQITTRLGNKIRIERKKHKLSQEKLAILTGLNKNFIGMIERGETNVTIKNLESITKALGMDIQEVFNFTI